MNTNNHMHSRDVQQDARAWAAFTGTNYTAALRQMESPFAQGLLGERSSARQLIATLDEHPLIGSGGGASFLGEDGVHSDSPWHHGQRDDFIELALMTEMLRMFTPVAPSAVPAVSSYSLKHTTERFLSPYCSYVSNGRLIWAAAALGLRVEQPEGGGHNLLIGISEREHDYVSRMVTPGRTRPQAHHYRPTGYTYLNEALARCEAGEPPSDLWVRPTITPETTPFHDWLVLQADRDDAVGKLAHDYSAGVRESDHGFARTPSDLLAILDEVPSSPEARDAAQAAVSEWTKSSQATRLLRTELISQRSQEVSGWGAGAGDIEHYEYSCPCGSGKIIEEHDNVPGFREHDVWIECDKCRVEWRFVARRSVRDWLLEPAATGSEA